MSRKLVVVGALLIGILAATSPANAGEPQPQLQPRRDRTYVDHQAGIIVIEASYQGSTIKPTSPGTGIQPAAATSGSAGGMSWTFRNVISSTTNNSQVHHYYAHSVRTAGSGSYKTHAHASMAKRVADFWDPLWGGHNDTAGCPADVTRTDATSETCRTSPWFNAGSSGQRWLGSSGHWFDVGNNGSLEGNCSGCIDIFWTRP